jgi:hypothetical protein
MSPRSRPSHSSGRKPVQAATIGSGEPSSSATASTSAGAGKNGTSCEPASNAESPSRPPCARAARIIPPAGARARRGNGARLVLVSSIGTEADARLTFGRVNAAPKRACLRFTTSTAATRWSFQTQSSGRSAGATTRAAADPPYAHIGGGCSRLSGEAPNTSLRSREKNWVICVAEPKWATRNACEGRRLR